jgi:hypothetical protein
MASVLYFSLSVGDLISLPVTEDAAPVNKCYRVTLYPLDEAGFCALVTFWMNKDSRSATHPTTCVAIAQLVM